MSKETIRSAVGAGRGGMNKGTVLTIALGMALAVLPARADIRTVELRVNGLTCPFCAFGIEKKLRKVDGVQEIEVLLDEGQIRLVFLEGNTATVRDLENAVDASGFELAGLQLVVRGTLVREGDWETLRVGPKQRIRLVEKGAGSARLLSPETLERLRSAAAGGAVLIGGEVHLHRDGLPSLAVERVEPVESSGE